MSTVLATYNIKGGVGKTSAAANLAYLAALGGAHTLLWDLDPQGASTYLFRVKPKVKGGAEKLVEEGRIDCIDQGHGLRAPRPPTGGFLLPPHGSRAGPHQAANPPTGARPRPRVAAEYDTFPDCPPSISLVSESVFEAADAVLVPMIPATLSSRTFDQLRRVVHSNGHAPQVLGFFSMVDGRKRLHREVTESLAAAHDVLTTAIPTSSDIERMGVYRTVVDRTAPRRRAARAYRALWREIRDRLGPQGT